VRDRGESLFPPRDRTDYHDYVVRLTYLLPDRMSITEPSAHNPTAGTPEEPITPVNVAFRSPLTPTRSRACLYRSPSVARACVSGCGYSVGEEMALSSVPRCGGPMENPQRGIVPGGPSCGQAFIARRIHLSRVVGQYPHRERRRLAHRNSELILGYAYARSAALTLARSF